MSILLGNGAKLEAEDLPGKPKLHRAFSMEIETGRRIINEGKISNTTALHSAVEKGDERMVRLILGQRSGYQCESRFATYTAAFGCQNQKQDDAGGAKDRVIINESGRNGYMALRWAAIS